MDNFKVIDETGKENTANVITVFSYKDREYLIYYIEVDNEESEIFVSRLEKDNDGYDKIVDIENEEEKKEIDIVVNEILGELK